MHWLAVVVAAALSASGAHRTKVAVLELGASTDATRDKAALLSPVVVGEFARDPSLSVIGSHEIAASLGIARQRALLGCAEDSCLAEIGGALGVDFIVSGQLGKLGSRYRLDLRLVKGSQGRIVASAGDFIEGTDDALADGSVRLSRALLEQLRAATAQAPAAHLAAAPQLQPQAEAEPAVAAAAPSASVDARPAGPSHTAAYVAFGAAGALAAGAVVMTLATRSTFNDVHDNPTDPQRLSKADSLSWKGPLSDGLWAAALISAGAGTYLFFSAPASGSGGELAVGGRF